MNENLDFMTGDSCVRADQLPVKASSERVKNIARAVAATALFLGVVGPGVPAPRVLANVTVKGN